MYVRVQSRVHVRACECGQRSGVCDKCADVGKVGEVRMFCVAGRVGGCSIERGATHADR